MPSIPRRQTGLFHLAAPQARVLQLFTARGERSWVPDWNPELLSGAEERGSVFQTRSHGDGGGRVTTWIVIDYWPGGGRASYARLAEGSSVGLVDVVCTPAPDGGTEVSVAYTLTPLNARAAVDVEEFLEPLRYRRMMEEWRAATADVLARGP